MYIAHRGAAAIYPEETYTAYDRCVRDGQLLLESDVMSLSDGTPVLMHDETVDRTTSGSGAVASYTKSTWESLRTDADDWHGSHFGTRLAVAQFAAWVNRYKGSSLLVPEDKDARSMGAMMAVLAAEKVHKDQILLQCFRLGPLQQAVAAGYNACMLVTSGRPDAALAAGVKWGGIPAAMTDAETRTWVGSGMNVLVWTVNRRYQRDAKLALGVKGFFSDDPLYLQGDLPVHTTDQFHSATWSPGMLPSHDDAGSLARGKFIEGGYWGYDHATASYQGCLQGYLCPIRGEARPSGYSVELSIRFGAVANGDPSRWASAFIGSEDRAFINSDEECSGYHFLFRRNGSVEIFKKAAGKSATVLAVKAGPALAEGDEARFRIRVDATTVWVDRLNADGSAAYGAKAVDDTYRGAYLTLGRSGLACGFRQVAIV